MNIVYGVYHFLGFHLCDYLLRKGVEVIGIDSGLDAQTVKEEMEEFYGRNANFHSWEKESSLAFSATGKVDVYIVLWDVTELKKVLGFLKQLEQKDDLETDINIFLSLEMDRKDVQTIKDACESEHSLQIKKWVYIDQLYGPWMPVDSLLYEHIKKGDYEQIEKENPIFIADFLSSLDQILCFPEKEVIIASEQEPQTELNREESEGKLAPKIMYRVPVHTTVDEGIGQLLKHEKKLNFIEQWNNN